MTEQVKKKRKRKSIEEKLKEIEMKEAKLISEKEKLMEQKKEQIEKENVKKKDILFSSFKKNIDNWNQLSNEDLTLLCDEIFSKFKKEINELI